ncbi:S8 family peptidase [Defluviimonas salinarum]|uniref:S8 family serine peptidase n=1 Tax=Defluviimonas salinarum TaxID=2992147 RepID=A0ABT3J769_9RHOB|nr:S8 family peptidase [Defluviimonas salinarum]MCW3783532.1 S8 family serine peptidase [Defluviimonas salinarum]
MRHQVSLLAITLFLAACGGEDGGGSVNVPADPAPAPVSDWLRAFVTSFDMEVVRAVRRTAGHLANEMSYTLNIASHPTLDGSVTITSNPLRAARVDHAHSTGLTGKGQVISIIDDGILASHEQFDGKVIHLSGTPAGARHGTMVASVAAGNGAKGGTIGVAPGADLHIGHIDYTRSIDWRDLAGHFDDARSLGAIVSNNSWSTTDSTYANTEIKSTFSSGARATYLAAMRRFAQGGVIIFTVGNDYHATSAPASAALAVAFPDLETSYLSVVNAIPVFDEERILSATRVSAACLETARYCLTANGQYIVAQNTGDADYHLGSGSSFAAPQVAGAIALLAEAFPDLTAQQLRARLIVTADNGFFTPTGSVTFAGGISHGYNEEFGHGFINLRDALLPIGGAAVPVAGSTDMIAAGTAAISGGALTGNSAEAALSKATVIAIDRMDGVFRSDAGMLAATSAPADLAEARLAAISPASLEFSRASLVAGVEGRGGYAPGNGLTPDLTAMELSGRREMTVLADGDARLSLIGLDGESAGFGFARGVEAGAGRFELGISALHERGGVLGITAPGYEDGIQGRSGSVAFGYAGRIGQATGIRLEGEIGMADGRGAGMITAIDNLRYDRIRFSLDRADVLSGGDVLTLFAGRPAGVSGGHAMMDLPVASSADGAVFQRTGVGLAPEARQLDIGLEYAAAVGRGTELSLGLTASRNHGHRAGVENVSAMAGIAVRF